MRADGVLRVILNVVLFPGMQCEQEEKYLRVVAMESTGLSHLALRLASASEAEDFLAKIREHIPAKE